MLFVRVDLNNSPTGDATGFDVHDKIAASGQMGYKLKGFIPVTIGPSGKILAYDLVFEAKEEAVSYDFVDIQANNNPAKSANFNDYDEIILQYEYQGYDFCGFVPVRIGPSGKILEIELVFAG
ncbi:MAG: hypothetical protein MJ246_07115 [Clostridia bacterium]|nr:hypothetical protein [Clostridia bacterium]